ncbi:MAG: hypothetical protein ACLFQH_07370 [Halothiobacillaceae bacterium]
MERERDIISEWMYEITPTARRTIDRLLEKTDLSINRRDTRPDILPVHLLDSDHVECARGILLGREADRLLIETPLQPPTGTLLHVEARTRHRAYFGRVLEVHPAMRAKDPPNQYILVLSVEAARARQPQATGP